MVDGGTRAFNDHFSSLAVEYRARRPTYPSDLFSFLADVAPARHRAWDCGTGSGQAAIGLARHFAEVVATDASVRQIERAATLPNVQYFACTAEEAALSAGSVDLVVVSQALHWFDATRFYAEIKRVTRAGAVFAAWMYGLHAIEPAIDGIVRRFYKEVVGPYWPPERRHVEEGYRSIPFPFESVPAPPFVSETQWALGDLVGYLGTWSSTERYKRAQGADPVELIATDLEGAWGDASKPRLVRWPLTLRVGRVFPY